jgi:hypothetical protein
VPVRRCVYWAHWIAWVGDLRLTSLMRREGREEGAFVSSLADREGRDCSVLVRLCVGICKHRYPSFGMRCLGLRRYLGPAGALECEELASSFWDRERALALLTW